MHQLTATRVARRPLAMAMIAVGLCAYSTSHAATFDWGNGVTTPILSGTPYGDIVWNPIVHEFDWWGGNVSMMGAIPPAGQPPPDFRTDARGGDTITPRGQTEGAAIKNITQPATASNGNGRTVLIWTEEFRGADTDIMGTILDFEGDHFTAHEISVSALGLTEYQPSVAIADDGSFVVVWTETQTNGDNNVVAQMFDRDGNKRGAAIDVVRTGAQELQPSVGMDARGNFVVAYTQKNERGALSILARMFDSGGNLLRPLQVAGGTGAFTVPRVACNRAGDFIVAYQVNTDSMWYIGLSEFGSDGMLRWGKDITPDTSDNYAARPSVAIDDAGHAVVAYKKWVNGNWDIVARWVDRNGPIGTEKVISDATGEEDYPEVALRRTGGDFVVVNTMPDGATVKVTPVTNWNDVGNSFTYQGKGSLAVSMEGDNFLVDIAFLVDQDGGKTTWELNHRAIAKDFPPPPPPPDFGK